MVRQHLRQVAAVGAILWSVLPASAQQRTYKWIDGMCESTIRYDSRKVDRAAVESTAELLNSERTVPLVGFVETPADVAKIDPEAFARDCAATVARMRAHKLLPIEGIEAFRQLRLRELEDSCAFGTAYAKGYRDPSALRAYTPASPHCDRFIDALEGKADLTAAWRKQIADGCQDNASPAACRRRYEERGEKPDGDAWKRIYLIGFGWNNCALRHSAFSADDTSSRDSTLEKLSKSFRRSYKVKQVCEEP